MSGTLVSVVIPAFNAAGTLDATLSSARGQSHTELEILVVDDGSTDGTASIVEAHARQDGRVSLITQANGGVARARNNGMAHASGAFIAPLDADDLWHPDKTRLQLAALAAAGDRAALAYGWFRRVDEQGRVLPVSPYPTLSGRVLHRHIDWNFISNGSTPLIRADVARAIGYEPALHDAGNQGCEDYLIQMRIAADYDFALVPGFVTGYRRTPGAMSSGVARMLRSHLQAYGLLRGYVRQDSARTLIDRRCAMLSVELALHLLRRKVVGDGMAALCQAVRHDSGAALTALG
ncbi:MAG: glycosyltransferase, partial [Sphingomonadaceae bacterium]|nr:glycosyltransferase [Sphingomonadaceae bacterium]